MVQIPMWAKRDQLSLQIVHTASTFRSQFLAIPALAQVVMIFAASRIVGWALFTVVGKQETFSPWSSTPMDYLSFVSIWDADWYRKIAEVGYPTQLPVDAAGRVKENTWAFYPLYPKFVAFWQNLLGGDYFVWAAIVSLLSGFIAAVIIYAVFKASVERVRAVSGKTGGESSASLALWGVALFSFAPIAPVLQVAYAEAFNLMFLAACLYFLIKKQWFFAVPFAFLASLSRPVGVPLGACAGILWFIAFVKSSLAHPENHEPSHGWGNAFRAHSAQLISALLICASALLWPVIAWMKTGRIDAYTATETAWRHSDLFLVQPWFEQSIHYFGLLGPIIFIVLILVFVAFLTSATVRSVLDSTLLVWCASYAGYLVLFLNPQSSLFRMLLPLFPLALALVAFSVSRAYRFTLLVGGTALQFGWVGWLWHWKELPTGGDYPP